MTEPKLIIHIVIINHNIGLRIPTGRRQTSWLFTSVVRDLNSGLCEQIQTAVTVGLELGASELQVQHSAQPCWFCCQDSRFSSKIVAIPTKLGWLDRLLKDN